MGKLDVTDLPFLSQEDFRVLTAIEMGMKNHELVQAPLAASIASLPHGGVNKLLRSLCQTRLLSYERAARYDGYRLTNKGYDYLALHSLTKRNTISSFGNQIGTGKESDIYSVADLEGNELCLKLHRLGRTCFRNIANKRDYHKNTRSVSWLYLSRISATKEFTYMKALRSRGFPVPEPIDSNRHCVIMELIKGHLLQKVKELDDVEKLYDKLMDLIRRFAESGVIHCDMNEFNIMIKEDESPVIIDFPQMVSTAHKDAKTYFKRDVKGIRTFFQKRFGFHSDKYPHFRDIVRTDTMDVEVRCSGFKKNISKDNKSEDQDESESEDESDSEVADESEEGESESEVESESDESEDDDESDEENKIEIADPKNNDKSGEGKADHCLVDGVDGLRLEDDPSCELDEKSDESSKRSKARSLRSSARLTSEEIRKRVKEELKRKAHKMQNKKCVAKGEASAATRARRDNNLTIKQSKWLWD